MSIFRVTSAELTAKVKSFAKRSKSFHRDMHVLALSCLNHAAQHGECTPLNAFYNDALPVAYQTSFKLFVKRIMDERGFNTGEWLVFKGGLFAVKTDVMDERTAFMDIVDELAEDKAFFDYDPVKEDKIFNALELVKALDNLVKKAKKDDADVPADLVAYLETVKVDVHRMAGVPTIQ
jgi:hypothetical protein